MIGHLNHLPVTHVYPQLVEFIRDRNLRTVTLNDVFLKTRSGGESGRRISTALTSIARRAGFTGKQRLQGLA